ARLETCARRVVEGEAWLADAKAAEDAAAEAAHQAQRDWEEACAKQLPTPSTPRSETASAATAINLSTLVDEGSLRFVDGPLFDLEGLEIDETERSDWARIKGELATSAQAKVQEALGPAAQQILKLREEAQALHARLQAKRPFEPLPEPRPVQLLTRRSVTRKMFSTCDCTAAVTYDGSPFPFYGDIFLSKDDELAFFPDLEAHRDYLNGLRDIDYDDWQEELARNAL
ncbi:unnamed protein product, partial [Prorocentrum cordatum]